MAIEYVAGAIEYTDGAWRIIDDDIHTPLNIADVDTREDSAVIHYTFKAKKVIILIAASDETYARAGICTGTLSRIEVSASRSSRLRTSQLSATSSASFTFAEPKTWGWR